MKPPLVSRQQLGKKPFGFAQDMLSKQVLGRKGEALAARYLTSLGFSIIARNFKARYGEIDIIALDGATLAFIEVKTRIGESFGKPEEAITPWKLREVVQTAQFYKSLHPELPEALRIDVVAIEFDINYQLISLKNFKSVTS